MRSGNRLVAFGTEAERTSWLMSLEADQGSGALAGLAVSEAEGRSELATAWLLRHKRIRTVDDLAALAPVNIPVRRGKR